MRPNFSGSHTFSLTANAKIGADTNSHKFVLTAARFWLQCWLAVRTMPQDLIGCWNQQKLKELIPCMVFFANDQSWAERRIDFAVLYAFIGAKEIQKIQMVVHIWFIHGTKVSVWQSWISLQVVDHEQCVECANQTSANQNTVHLKTSFIWKFSPEWLLWTGNPSRGSLRKKPKSPTEKY